MSDNHFTEDKVKNKTTFTELLRRLWPQFMKEKGLFGLTMLSVLLLSIIGRLLPTIFGYAIDQGILKKDQNVIVRVAIAYFVLKICETGFVFLHSYLFAKLGNRILFDLRNSLIHHVQMLPVSFFDKNPAGRIVTRVTNDVVSLGELFTQGIIAIFSNLISMVAIVIAMMMISVKMALITLLIAPPLMLIGVHLSNLIRVVLRDSKKRLAIINSFVAENISGMRVLQLYSRLRKNSEKFQTLSQDYRDVQMRSVTLYALLWPTVNFFNATSVAMALYFGGQLAFTNAVSTGAMIAFILHVRDFITPLRVMLEKYQAFQNSLSGAERIFTLLDEKQESRDGIRLANERLKGQIEFQNLSFQYRPELPMVLENIHLLIEPGQSVALVGRTGSGKSTLISLLQKFYAYQEGEILLDGTPLRTIAQDELRRRIGVVQQDTFMFRGSIASNIGLNDDKITPEQIARAAELARCQDLLRRHQGGLSAHVEERGANLSFGERQLLAFARILAFDPDILILDEATANIDSQSEVYIQEATRNLTKGRTSIIIAHRISTVLDCDKIVVLDQGRMIEIGTHQELMAKRTMYFSLCQSQFQADELPENPHNAGAVNH